MTPNDSNTPRYRLLSPCYLEDDTLHVEGEEIWYTGIPNEEMEPLNELARQRSREYIDSLDDAARAVAAAKNRPFTGRLTDHAAIDQMIDDSRAEQRARTVLPVSRDDVPIRPDLATPAQKAKRDADRPKRVLGSKAPAPRSNKPAHILVGPQIHDPSAT